MANTLTIRGNLTKAPEDNPHGENRNGAYVFFTLAENRKNSDGEEVDPYFHRIAAYGRVAENFLASNTPKGTRLMAEVRIGYEDIVILRDDKEYDDKRPRDRYAAETRRLLGVLDQHLVGRDWMMGSDYGIADIAIFPWVRNLVGFYEAGELVGFGDFKEVQRVLEVFLARPAVQRGLVTPARD